MINTEILSMTPFLVVELSNLCLPERLGLHEKSVLDILMGHLVVMEEKIRQQNSNYGEVFKFKV